MKNKKVCFYSLVVVLFVAGFSLHGMEDKESKRWNTLKGVSLEKADNNEKDDQLNQLNDEEKESIKDVATELFEDLWADLKPKLEKMLKQVLAEAQKNFEANITECAIASKEEEEGEGEEGEEITEL